jgi:hypothetical protein
MPQRRIASAIAAASIASRVTSASNGTHSDACALASKPQYRCSTVTDAFTGALPGANNDRNLVFKPHSNAPLAAPGPASLSMNRATTVSLIYTFGQPLRDFGEPHTRALVR